LANGPPEVGNSKDAIALKMHAQYRGKIQTMPKCAISGLDDFAVWYTPGVAAPCREIARHPQDVYRYTNKGNSIAIISDGTRVLGLGDIGPLAGLPVMEGKAMLFKYLGGVDAVALCLDSHNDEELIRTVKMLEPSFGGINLEDIAQPRCFTILDRLREDLNIPIWHDDQQGTATVVLAGLLNALALVGKSLSEIKITLVGAGAANMAVYRLLASQGVDQDALIACDTNGTLHRNRDDLAARQDQYRDKWRVCTETNTLGLTGGIEEALQGADVCIAFSGPQTIAPEWVRAMAPDAIVFACANPVPDIMPSLAEEAGAHIVCTGRSDFPNQVNNSLCFPGIFRGVLDVGARQITESMSVAAATALAGEAVRHGLTPRSILPPINNREVPVRLAVATGLAAQAEGIARLSLSEAELEQKARRKIEDAHQSMALLMQSGVIQAP
jgi:malate dehydrogenase (oxaloacetate-decarboxylating)